MAIEAVGLEDRECRGRIGRQAETGEPGWANRKANRDNSEAGGGHRSVGPKRRLTRSPLNFNWDFCGNPPGCEAPYQEHEDGRGTGLGSGPFRGRIGGGSGASIDQGKRIFPQFFGSIFSSKTASSTIPVAWLLQ